MRNSSNKPRLNYYAKWKYGVLIVTLIVMLLSALPTWYGEDAAVQLGGDASAQYTPAMLSTLLEDHDIKVKRISQHDATTLIVLENDEQQTALKNLLSEQIATTATSHGGNLSTSEGQVTLALTPAAPDWLVNLGFKPIKFGLDLRGGVQFLLDVDVDLVYQAQQEMLTTAVRQFSREQHLPSVSVIPSQNARITIKVEDVEVRANVRQFLKQQFPLWQVTNTSQGLSAALTDAELINLRNLTVQQNLLIMRSRIEQLGITEAMVQRQGEQRIRIELPGVQDPAAAKKVIGATASLAFYELKPEGSVNAIVLKDKQDNPVYVARQAVLTGEHIVDARASIGEMGMAKVNISLDSVGGSIMSDFTRANVGKPMATAYSEYSRDNDGNAKQTTQIISVATISSQFGARFEVTGAGTYQEAQQLALLLRAGSMTAPVTIVEERTIGPSLGAQNIENGFAALALGLGITLAFMALWYRRLGWVANVALLANMVLLFGLLALIPGAVLTLPGIAGLVLTVGMAVDTNVLIFERIRDNLKEGRSFATAIDSGFNSAFSTIFDANFTTMITAVVLYSIGNGPIQGFALTLALGLLTSMFTGIFASRALINLVYGRDNRRGIKV